MNPFGNFFSNVTGNIKQEMPQGYEQAQEDFYKKVQGIIDAQNQPQNNWVNPRNPLLDQYNSFILKNQNRGFNQMPQQQPQQSQNNIPFMGFNSNPLAGQWSPFFRRF